MIVMKFGGSSLESVPAIRRALEIVKSQLPAGPIIVVSAIGKTTDKLLELAGEAERGHSYPAWKGLKDLWEFHSETAAGVCAGESLEWLNKSLHQHFKRLHRVFVTMEDEGGRLTPELRDEVASYGERLSSEIFAAALQSSGVPAVHLDSRQLIVTDDHFTRATPLYWETYAKLRRAIPPIAQRRTVVLGGFIGATESGATTTLGRGGSDLTASLVGAGVGVEEIQIWTDVDGMLTADPRLFQGALRLKSLSYDEAAEMARGGAKVLHPDTIRPAVRQRIPIVIRNSRRPETPGTRITAASAACSNLFKSIAARQHMTLLEVRLQGAAGSSLDDLRQLCARHAVSPQLIAGSKDVAWLATAASDPSEQLQLEMQGCVEVRLHPRRAILTLAGWSSPAAGFAARVLEVLKNPEAFIVPGPSAFSLTVVLPQRDLGPGIAALHHEFFGRVDPEMFAKVEQPQAVQPDSPPAQFAAVTHTARRQPRLTLAHPLAD